MGFQEILDQWRAAARTEDADHADAALDTFRNHSAKYKQVLNNLNDRRSITEARREELLTQLLTVVPHEATVVISKVISFCHSHQCSGAVQKTAQRSSLGHVQSRKSFVRTLQSARVTSATSFATGRRRGAGPAVADILRSDLPRQMDRLRGIYLSERIMWSFYQSRSPDDPFRRVSKAATELVRRLGLGLTDPTKEELILWGHRLEAHQTAHVPTSFDAADYEFFRPGGITKPISGDDGLREVVHRPIKGDQLSHRVEKAV